MTADRRVELVVLGGGPGGYAAAIRAAQLGVSTLLVEEAHLGGVCLNEGCVPSKALIHHAAEAISDVARGLIGDLVVSDRFATSRQERVAIIDRLRSGVQALLRSNGVEVLAGRGTIVDLHMLRVDSGGNTIDVHFDDLIVATGSQAVVPAGLEIDGQFVLTARQVLELELRPSRAVVVGGGYIGLELAGALSGFGTEIIVVEATDRLLMGIEPMLAEHLTASLRAQQIDIRFNTRVAGAADGQVTVTGPRGGETLDADIVIVAVGRAPRTSNIGLDVVGVTVEPSGHIAVDVRMSTGVPHVWAIGDVTPGPALAHRAMAQGRVAAEAIAGIASQYRPAAVPAVVFTTPEIATVGLSIGEALERGIDAQQVQFPLAANARALTLDADGFGLLVFDASSELVLGAHLIGPGVGEMIGAVTLAIEMGAVLDDLAGTIFPHPTVSEIFGELADVALGLPTHVAPASGRSARSRSGSHAASATHV